MIILLEKETGVQKLQKATDNNKDNHRDILTGKFRSGSRASEVANANNKFQLQKGSVSKGNKVFLNKNTNKIYKKIPDNQRIDEFQEYIITDLTWSVKKGYSLTLENPKDRTDKVIWTESGNKESNSTAYIQLLNKLYWHKTKNKTLLNSYNLLKKPIAGMNYSVAQVIASLVDQYHINPASEGNTSLNISQAELCKFIISKQMLQSSDPTFAIKTIFYMLNENTKNPQYPFNIDLILDKNNKVLNKEQILKRIETWKETGLLSGKSRASGKSYTPSKAEIALMANLTGETSAKAEKSLLNITSLEERNELLHNFIETKISRADRYDYKKLTFSDPEVQEKALKVNGIQFASALRSLLDKKYTKQVTTQASDREKIDDKELQDATNSNK